MISFITDKNWPVFEDLDLLKSVKYSGSFQTQSNQWPEKTAFWSSILEKKIDSAYLFEVGLAFDWYICSRRMFSLQS